MRKDDKTSFIVHPMETALIVARANGSPEAVAGALLHDTVEDTPYTFAALQVEFGDAILEIVSMGTENLAIVDWEQRKRDLLQRLEKASVEAKLVKAADVLSNMGSLTEGILRDGEAFWTKFRTPKTFRLHYFDQIRLVTADVQPPWLQTEFDRLLGGLSRI